MNKLFSEIYKGVITDLAKEFGKKFLNSWGGILINSIEKSKIDSVESFIDYLEYSSDRYSKVKTLIYSRNAEYLYDFYVPAKVLRKGRREKIDSSNIHNLLDIGNNLIITGTGGIGKSLMLKYLFLETIKNTSYVPVFIELRNLNDFNKDKIDLESFIYDELVKIKLKLNKKCFKYSLETGCYVMLFDGFDELKSEIVDIVIKSILDISDKYQKNYFIVSSRPWQGFIGWNNFEELEIMEFEKDQSLEMISKLNYDESVKENFIKSLDDSLFEKYKSFATIPLLLTMMFLTYEKRPNLPDKLNDFYEQVFMTLFYTHDSTKNGYVRQHRSKLGYEDFRLVFAYFCFQSYFHHDYEFSEREFLDYMKKAKDKRIILTNFSSDNFLMDLNIDVCMLIKEGLKYKFSHRSFQEYFAAYYTTLLNDEQQKVLIKKMRKIYHYYGINTTYKKMLFDLQPSRYINNFFREFVEELRSFYISNNEKPECFVRFWFKSFSPFNGVTLDYEKASYNDDILFDICDFLNFEYQNRYHNGKRQKCMHRINDYLCALRTKGLGPLFNPPDVSVNKLLESDIKEDLIIYFDDLIQRSLFAINAIKDNETDYSEKSLQDMLDEF